VFSALRHDQQDLPQAAGRHSDFSGIAPILSYSFQSFPISFLFSPILSDYFSFFSDCFSFFSILG
jgi:hypothetical protein